FTHRLRQGSNDIGTTASEAFEHGRYAHHLRGWFGQFPPSQILVLQYERCVRDPYAELARTYRFLELDDSFCPSELTEAVNRTNKEKVGLGSEARARLRVLYAPEVAELADLVPDLDVGLWKNFA
ncbi:MAG: sulfotransferase domain-containing protein, partial [Acidimicrobiales bacterium]